MPQLFSIIIPVYNVEKFLSKCIDSIISQTYKEWEIILVNDGSTDSSGEICNDYAANDSRIHAFHTKNHGVSVARNIGIRKALGEWLTFIDSDDYVENNWLEAVYNKIQTCQANIYTWGNYYEDNNGIELQEQYIPEEKAYKNSTEFIKTRNYRHGVVWYMYKTQWMKKYNCEFPEGIKRSEDQCFLLQYLSHNPTILPICQPFYHYVRHTDSVTCSPYTIDDVGDNLRVATIFAEYAKKYENIDKNFIFYSTTQLFHDFLDYAKDIDELFDSYTQTVFRKYYDEIVHLFPEFTKDTPLKRAYKSIKSAYCRDRITNMLQNYTIGCTILNIWHKIHL